MKLAIRDIAVVTIGVSFALGIRAILNAVNDAATLQRWLSEVVK